MQAPGNLRGLPSDFSIQTQTPSVIHANNDLVAENSVLSLDKFLGGIQQRTKKEEIVADNPTRPEIAAMFGKHSAETDTKIARLEGKLDLVLSKMDQSIEGTRATRANQWVIGTALAVLMVALAFGVPAIFGSGLQFRDVIHSEVGELLKEQPKKP